MGKTLQELIVSPSVREEASGGQCLPMLGRRYDMVVYQSFVWSGSFPLRAQVFGVSSLLLFSVSAIQPNPVTHFFFFSFIHYPGYTRQKQQKENSK